ncbi:MAG: Co2+/Mg2+ efflux protein ApaG [Bdellovibrionota bacterium]
MKKMATDNYVQVTHNVRVSVFPQFSVEHSNVDMGTFVYLYTITITNESEEILQLLSRHWIITDGLGNEEQVIGEGVVGQKPVLNPGGSFSYTSSCPLKTPSGSMKGRYQLKSSTTEIFDVQIPEFYLRDSRLLN